VLTVIFEVKVEIVIAIVGKQGDVLDTVALCGACHVHTRIKITTILHKQIKSE
jgi:hypothetical protein